MTEFKFDNSLANENDDFFNEQFDQSFDETTFDLNSNISKKINKPVEEEIGQLEKVHKGTVVLDVFYQKMLEKKWSLLDRWKDKSMYEKVSAIKSEMFEMSADHRMTIYDLLLQTRVQQTKEKCDSGLKCLKSHYRRKVASFIMFQMEELVNEIKGYQFRFIEMMKSKHQYANGLKEIPSLHKKYLQTLFNEETRYLRFLEALIVKFESTINEELKLYKR